MDLKRGLERGPFNGKEAEKLYEALAGLDSGQLQWLNGYFAGLSQATTSDSANRKCSARCFNKNSDKTAT